MIMAHHSNGSLATNANELNVSASSLTTNQQSVINHSLTPSTITTTTTNAVQNSSNLSVNVVASTNSNNVNISTVNTVTASSNTNNGSVNAAAAATAVVVTTTAITATTTSTSDNSNSCSLLNSDSRWIFNTEKIENSPSRLDGISEKDELSKRQQAALLISELGAKLKVNQLCMNTAIIYMHRFYMIHSLKKFHHYMVATACLFFACKVEEQPRRLREVIDVFQSVFHKSNEPVSHNSEEYRKYGDEIMALESCLIQTLGFNVLINHAHTVIIKTCQMIKAPRDLAEAAYMTATNCLILTNFCVKFSSEKVACFCIYLGCKWTGLKIPMSSEGMQWFEYVNQDIKEQELEEISTEYLTIYDQCSSVIKKKLGLTKTQDETNVKQQQQQQQAMQAKQKHQQQQQIHSHHQQNLKKPTNLTNQHLNPRVVNNKNQDPHLVNQQIPSNVNNKQLVQPNQSLNKQIAAQTPQQANSQSLSKQPVTTTHPNGFHTNNHHYMSQQYQQQRQQQQQQQQQRTNAATPISNPVKQNPTTPTQNVNNPSSTFKNTASNLPNTKANIQQTPSPKISTNVIKSNLNTSLNVNNLSNLTGASQANNISGSFTNNTKLNNNSNSINHVDSENKNTTNSNNGSQLTNQIKKSFKTEPNLPIKTEPSLNNNNNLINYNQNLTINNNNNNNGSASNLTISTSIKSSPKQQNQTSLNNSQNSSMKRSNDEISNSTTAAPNKIPKYVIDQKSAS